MKEVDACVPNMEKNYCDEKLKDAVQFIVKWYLFSNHLLCYE